MDTPSAGGGRECPELTESKECGTSPCSVDCRVSQWSSWSTCSTSCGDGVQQSSRSIITPPLHGGTSCGDLTKSKACNVEACFITTPNFPSNYPNSFDVTHPIEAKEGHLIHLHFTSFDVESAEDCRYDYVMLREKVDTILLPRICGRMDKHLHLISSTQQVVVMFHTDRSVTSIGFLIQWEEIQADTIK